MDAVGQHRAFERIFFQQVYCVGNKLFIGGGAVEISKW